MSGPQPRPGLKNIAAHMVTADTSLVSQARIHIASNESVFGPSPEAIKAIEKAAQTAERYAEGSDFGLANLIAEKYQLNPQNIVVGPGSDDLLARVARAFLQPGDELICSVHGYQKIPNYAYANDAVPVKAADKDFRADVDQILNCISDRTRIVMLANPDNPTGTWLPGVEIRRLHKNLPSHVLLVLDSAYLEYVSDDSFENPTSLIEQSANVVMTRTFSKLFGLAGLRLGWLYSNSNISSSVRKIGLTFPISNVAFAAASAALTDDTHIASVFRRNLSVRTNFIARIRKIGLHAYPSQTNFVLIEFPEDLAKVAYDHMLNLGIITRRQASSAFRKCIRFTIASEQEMDEVYQVLSKFMSNQSANYLTG